MFTTYCLEIHLLSRQPCIDYLRHLQPTRSVNSSASHVAPELYSAVSAVLRDRLALRKRNDEDIQNTCPQVRCHSKLES
jgi:hypothetical protein